MRKTLYILLVLLLVPLSSLPAAFVDAQSATPAGNVTNPPPATTKTTPVEYISESGSVIATMTVSQIVRPWTEFDDFYEPTSGTEYIAFTVTFDYAGRRSDLVVRGYDFRLQDIDGFLLTEAWVSPTTHATVVPGPDELVLSPGESGTITVVFQVIEDIELGHLFWSPEYDRLITLIDFTHNSIQGQ